MRGRVILVWAYIVISYTPNLHAFQLGIENISASLIQSAAQLRIGLITNHTGRDQQGNRTVDILQQKGLCISYILAPEHGFEGTQGAGKPVTSAVDQKTGIAIVSMYGAGGDHTMSGKHIDAAIMNQIDMLCYDIQDAGMRHYTYISTLLCVLEAAAHHEKPMIVFDRPNLLGPHMEGPLVDDHLKSFISIASIPLRHGMTVGELAQYFNKYVIEKPAHLHVVTMKDYDRTMSPMWLSSLSPNVSSLAALYGYSFLGILGEVAPFHLGVGTPDAFQTIMVPADCNISLHEWDMITSILNAYGIQCSYHTASRKGRLYTGLKLQITNGMKVASFALLLELLSFFHTAGIALSYSISFDKAVGTDKLKGVYQGTHSLHELKKKINMQLEQFFIKAKDAFLYEPLPEIQRLS
jgi:uncharacterized protein YbbC (DUF1343 family)